MTDRVNPPPRQDKDLTGHVWQEWFRSIYSLIGPITHDDGHWYLKNGATHSIVDCVGIKTSTTTVGNTVTETTVFSYTMAANELHSDERVMFDMTGSLSAATGAETLTVRYKVGGATQMTLVVTPKNAAGVGWQAQYQGTIRTSGATGTFLDYARFTTDTGSTSLASIATTVINTTTTQLFEVTVQWGAAKVGNTVSCTQGSISYYH